MVFMRIQVPIWRLSDSMKSQILNRWAHQTWVTGFSILIFSGNCAFVTRKVEIRLRWSSSTSELISGYMIGSPTSDRAQCLGESPSIKRSGLTPVRKIPYPQLNFSSSNWIIVKKPKALSFAWWNISFCPSNMAQNLNLILHLSNILFSFEILQVSQCSPTVHQ